MDAPQPTSRPTSQFTSQPAPRETPRQGTPAAEEDARLVPLPGGDSIPLPDVKEPTAKKRSRTGQFSMLLAIVVGGLLLASWLLGDESNAGGFFGDLAEVVWQGNEGDGSVIVLPDGTPIHLPTPLSGRLPAPQGADDWYAVHFTAPLCPPEAEREGGLDALIAADLLRATEAVDVATFDLDAETIVSALIALEDRGIEPRVVTDSDNAGQASIRRLRRNGISVREDERSGLMHNKFIVIDERIVWTGSLNFTSSGVYCNNNNFVRFELPLLAANYVSEMDEMFNERQFGPDSPDSTPNEQIDVPGTEIENYFAPERELINTLGRTVARAEEEILVMAFSFTSPEIGESMLGRAEAGVRVRAVFETTGSETLYSYYPKLSAEALANVQVRQDGNSRIMHHKVIIVDRKTVVFGSFNFSESANRRNDENIVIVHSPTFARAFVDEFERVWAHAEPDE